MAQQFTGSLQVTGSILIDGVSVTASNAASVNTGSFLTNGTVTNFITGSFTKGDGTTFDLIPTIPTSSITSSVDIQTFTTSSTWYKPANAKLVIVNLVGAGGGGGSARRGGASTTRAGGGGGAGGGLIQMPYPAALLPSECPVTIGLGGTGGAAVTVDNTNGNAGSAGGWTIFGDTDNAYLVAASGSGGTGEIGRAHV